MTPMTRSLRLPSLAILAGLAILSCARAADQAIDGYSDYDAFTKQVAALAKPGVAENSSLGTTLGGRKILEITIGTGKTAEKPAILIVGNVYAPQLVGSELAVRMARRLIERSAA